MKAVLATEPTPDARWTLALPPDLQSVGAARRFVGSCCNDAGVVGAARDSAVLLTSESVTNAFVHGRSEARIAVVVVPGGVLIEVGDDNSRHPKVVEPDPNALDGRGLLIMMNLATRWGVRNEEVGKTVWFEVHTDGP